MLVGKKIGLVFFIVFSSVVALGATKGPVAKPGACAKTFIDIPGGNEIDKEQGLKAEAFTMADLLQEKDSDNLAVKHPFLLMSAAQRVLAVVNNAGFKNMNLYGVGDIMVPNLFHSAGPETDFKMIVGHEGGTAKFVSQLKRAIARDANVISFTGPHGTGKSEILSVLGAALKVATEDDPSFYYYTYEWKNLDKIEALHPVLLRSDGNYVGTKKPETRESPFVLFPKVYQDWIKKKADGKVRKLVDSAPSPFTHMLPKTKRIRDAIIKQEILDKNIEPTAENIVKALMDHVVIKRALLGDQENLVKLDSQGPDWNAGQLFVSQNMKMAMKLDSDEPFVWDLGIVARASGSVLFLDEVLRNDPSLRDKWLTLFQDRSIQNGGSVTVPLDMLIITATNDANVRDVNADPKGRAHTDRYLNIPFRYSTEPQVIAPTIALMKAGELYATKLEPSIEADPRSEEPKEAIRVFPENRGGNKSLIGELWPRAQVGEEAITPHGRYKLWIGDGENRIDVAPHVIELLGMTAAASRMYTNAEEAKQAGMASDILSKKEFRDPVSRILFFSGNAKINNSLHIELANLVSKMGEGEDGLPTRVLGRWLNASLDYAARPKGENTLDFVALKKGLETLATDNETFSHEMYQKTVDFFDQIMSRIILPKVSQDFNSAIVSDPNSERNAYFNFIAAERAIHENPGTTTFKSSKEEDFAIDEERQEKIKKSYFMATGRAFTIEFINNFYSNRFFNAQKKGESVDPSKEINEDLMAAVRSVLADDITSHIGTLESFAELASGGSVNNQEVVSEYQRFSNFMKKRYGYNSRSLRSAINLVKEKKLRTKKNSEEN